MKRKSLGSLRPVALLLALLPGLAASALGASQPAIYATSQFQREVDTPSPGPSGLAVLEEKGSVQIFSVTANNLSGPSGGSGGSSASNAAFGVFISTANNTNTPVSLIGPMNLLGTNDTWVLKYEGVGAAPAQLGVADLQELSGLYLVIGNPGPTNIVGGSTNIVDCVTNIVGCVTNIIDGLTNIVDCVPEIDGCVTNIDGGVTNFFANTVLFAQIPPFTTKAEAPHYNLKSHLTTLSIPPNPIEKGYVKTVFTGSTGHSFFDLYAHNLSGGQPYSIFIEYHIPSPASTIMSNIGPLAISTNEIHAGSYTRDTRRGETLPFSSATVSNLSGRAIQIRDEFDEIHLEGTIP
ncbi:MAG: hypothetical protein ACLP0A_02730 [Verrucomicrobiia bacterium]